MGYFTCVGTDLSESTALSGKDPFLFRKSDGFSLWTAAVFLVAMMAGMGVLALPHALASTGWWGMAIITLVCINSCYCGVTMGRIWIIMEEQWVEYRCKIRSPYPGMAEKAVGTWMRYVVAVILQTTILGIAIVYLLLCAQIALSVTEGRVDLPYNYWILLLAVALCPFTWFGSIEEFRFAAYGALATAALACTLLFAAILMMALDPTRTQTYVECIHPSFSSFSLAFGTIIFSFGGVFFFPTVHNDMARREEFPKATVIGFVGLLILYMPATISGYAILGSADIPANLLNAIQDGPLKCVIQVSLALHVFLAFLLFINPVAQEIEEACGIASSFTWKRCCIRTAIMAIVVVVAYTIPHFDKILNLIGGSTLTLLTFVFPPVFYFLLLYKTGKKNEMTKWEVLLFLQIVITGIAGGAACTYFAIFDIYQTFGIKDESSIVLK